MAPHAFAQHVEQMIEDPDGVPQRVRVNMGESPLMWLRSRKHVTERQYHAGDLLRRDWETAGLGPRVTMRWDAVRQLRRPGSVDPASATVSQISARSRFDGAMAHAGSGLGDILWRVACAGEGMEAAESALGWPRRAGKVVLCLGLDRIADYYGIG